MDEESQAPSAHKACVSCMLQWMVKNQRGRDVHHVQRTDHRRSNKQPNNRASSMSSHQGFTANVGRDGSVHTLRKRTLFGLYHSEEILFTHRWRRRRFSATIDSICINLKLCSHRTKLNLLWKWLSSLCPREIHLCSVWIHPNACCFSDFTDISICGHYHWKLPRTWASFQRSVHSYLRRNWNRYAIF